MDGLIEMLYKIGDFLHASVISDYTFEVEFEITSILSLKAALEYEDVVRKLFHASGINSNYDNLFLAPASQNYYLGRVLKPVNSFDLNSKIILNDSLIDPLNTYYIEEDFTVITNVQYSVYNTNFRKRQQVVDKIKQLLESENITNVTVKVDKTDEEKLKDKLDYFYNIILKIKELESCTSIIQNLKNINLEAISTEFANNITAVKKLIDELVIIVDKFKNP